MGKRRDKDYQTKDDMCKDCELLIKGKRIVKVQIYAAYSFKDKEDKEERIYPHIYWDFIFHVDFFLSWIGIILSNSDAYCKKRKRKAGFIKPALLFNGKTVIFSGVNCYYTA